MELFRLFGTIGLNDAAARQGLRNIDNQAAQTGNKLNVLGKIGGAFGAALAAGAAAAVGGMTVLTGLVARTGIAYNAMAEQSQVAWTTLLGSQDKAKKMLQDIANFAKSTPFETEQVDMMAKYMHNAGLEGKDLFDALMKVSDVSSAFNIPAAEAKELTRQMSQVRQAGVAYTEDLNVLQDRGVPIYKAISKQLGITVADVKKMASEGKISSDIYIKAFDGIASSVKGASDAQSKTFSGLMSTLSDNLKQISGELMKGAFEKLKGTIDKLMPILERFSTTLKDQGLHAALAEIFGEDKVTKAENFFNTVKDVGVVAFNLLKDTIKFVGDNFNWLMPILVGVLSSITAFNIISTVVNLMNIWKASTFAQILAQEGLNAALIANPIGLVVTAIGLLVAAGILLYKNWDTVKEKTRQLWDKLGAFKGVATVVLGPLGFIIRAAVTMAEQWDSTKSVWENVWNGIKLAASNAVNDVIGSINSLIKMINKIPGVSIPLIPKVQWGKVNVGRGSGDVKRSGVDRRLEQYASGTNFAPGGLAIVGERGPELVNLPRGSKVYTANRTKDMINQQESKQPVIVQIVTPDKREIAQWLVNDIAEFQQFRIDRPKRFGG